MKDLKELLNKILDVNKFKDIKSFKDIRNIQLDQKSIAVILVVLILIVYLDYSFLMKGQMKAVSKVGPKVTKISKDLNELTKNLLSIQGLKDKEAMMAGSKIKKVISQEQVPLLLEEISKVANEEGIKITQIKPSRDTAAKRDKSASGGLDALQVSLDLVCGYHNLGKFINDLENSQFFIQVQSVKITEKEKDSAIQSVGLVLRTYVKK